MFMDLVCRWIKDTPLAVLRVVKQLMEPLKKRLYN